MICLKMLFFLNNKKQFTDTQRSDRYLLNNSGSIYSECTKIVIDL